MKMLYVKDRNQWREWLQKNGARVKEVWLIYYKKHADKPRIPYEDAVEEALCFGWIDGKIRKLDEMRFAQRFSPRSSKSRWSKINIARARRMIRAGKMCKEGLAVFNPQMEYEARPTKLPQKLQSALEGNSLAWRNFQQFPPYYRKMMVIWIASAKKEETQHKRLAELIRTASANQRIKLM
jgi:uncharacterized protein YdeI (YjbR/CyaY-like superfamily)